MCSISTTPTFLPSRFTAANCAFSPIVVLLSWLRAASVLSRLLIAASTPASASANFTGALCAFVTRCWLPQNSHIVILLRIVRSRDQVLGNAGMWVLPPLHGGPGLPRTVARQVRD